MIPGRRGYNLIGTDEDPIPENEPVFILRAQDVLAETIVRMYAVLARTQLGNTRLANSALVQAQLFAEWPTKKTPDL